MSQSASDPVSQPIMAAAPSQAAPIPADQPAGAFAASRPAAMPSPRRYPTLPTAVAAQTSVPQVSAVGAPTASPTLTPMAPTSSILDVFGSSQAEAPIAEAPMPATPIAPTPAPPTVAPVNDASVIDLRGPGEYASESVGERRWVNDAPPLGYDAPDEQWVNKVLTQPDVPLGANLDPSWKQDIGGLGPLPQRQTSSVAPVYSLSTPSWEDPIVSHTQLPMGFVHPQAQQYEQPERQGLSSGVFIALVLGAFILVAAVFALLTL